jgi:ketosteroid isomerase-like protein
MAPGSAAAASACSRMRRLYWAVKVRRLASARTSGLGRSGDSGWAATISPAAALRSASLRSASLRSAAGEIVDEVGEESFLFKLIPILALLNKLSRESCLSYLGTEGLMRMLTRIFRTFAISSALLLPAFSQQVKPPRDLVETQEKFRQALRQNDADTLSQLLMDDFVRSPPTSPDTTKVQYLDAIRSGKLKYSSAETKEERYRVYGDTVLVNAVSKVSALVNGQRLELTIRTLSVWINQNGRWLLAAIQANQVPAQ